MYCKQCNRENPDDNRFCEFCGAELKPSAENPKMFFSSKKMLIIIIGILLLIGAAVAAALYISNGQHGEYHQKIDAGDQYLEKQEYEKAETAYLDAIKLEPKQEKAYIKAADLYMKQENYEEAEKILTSGEEHAGGTEIPKKIKEVRKLRQEADANCWEFFKRQSMLFKPKQELEEEYGELSLRNEGSYGSWQDNTFFNPSFWFAGEDDPTFSLDESQDEVCDGTAGTAGQLFGLEEELTMEEFEAALAPDEAFKIFCTTDVMTNGWVCSKKLDGRMCDIYVYPDGLDMVGYQYEYDPTGGLDDYEDIPEVGVSELSVYMEGYTENPSKIKPETHVVVLDQNGRYYKKRKS